MLALALKLHLQELAIAAMVAVWRERERQQQAHLMASPPHQARGPRVALAEVLRERRLLCKGDFLFALLALQVRNTVL